MKSLTKYAFINSKIRGMLSHLLSESQLQGLSSAEGIDEFFSLLKSTPYKLMLEGLTSPYDLKIIEKRLFSDGVEKYNKILKNLKGKSREVIFLMLSRYEITNLKNLLRLWHTKDEETNYLYERKICYDIPIPEILSAGAIEEIILLLDKTPYKDALMEARAKFKKKGSLFYLEVALDIDYYKRLWGKIKILDSVDRQVASKLTGVEVDIQNINWIVRFKQYYEMPLGELTSYIIPGGYKIAYPLVRKVYPSGDIKSVISGLSTKPYQEMAALVNSGYDKSKMFMLEVMLWQVLLKEVRLALSGFPFTIATIMAYLILYKAEAKNIISLLYSKLYQWEPDRIKRSLIC